MPWTLKAPRAGRTPFWYIRGTYLGITLDRSTGTGERRAAKRILDTWKKQAERGEFERGPAPQADLFLTAARSYMLAGGPGQFVGAISRAWPTKLLTEIDQAALDTLAVELYPAATAATRNRQVYTPVSAILKHAGVEKRFKRPRGWKGKKSTSWLEPAQAFALLEEAARLDPEFGLLCLFLLYTGMRLNEALTRHLSDLRLERAFIYLDDSKTEEARGCHLPPVLVEAFTAQPPRRVTPVVRNERGWLLSAKPLTDEGVPFLERAPDARLFRYHDGGALRDLLKTAMAAASLSFPRRQRGFHLFCHTYGTWMFRFGGLDAHGLTDTGRWADPDSAYRYVHTMASEAAQRADILPVPPRREAVEGPWKNTA